MILAMKPCPCRRAALAIFTIVLCCAAPQAALAQNVTLTGTLISQQSSQGAQSVTYTYTLDVPNGQTYKVDFSSPQSIFDGPRGKGHPTPQLLLGTNGAQVEITGDLQKNTLKALQTRFISAAPIIQSLAKGGGEGFGQKALNFFVTYGVPICFVLLVIGLFMSMRMMPGRGRKEKLAASKTGKVRWDDVAGCEDAKEELKEIVEFLRHPSRFKHVGARVPRGVLLHGPPGTGKTLLARAVATEAGARFYHQSASSFTEVYVGVGARRVRNLFKQARRRTVHARLGDRLRAFLHLPAQRSSAIIFIDELDAAGKKRGGSFNDESDRTLNELLVAMDGFTEHDNIVVIGATNHTESLDPALLRPGRFDRQVMISPPDLAGRREILSVHTRGKPVEDVDLEKIAKHTAGLAGADLANLCNEAAIYAGRRGSHKISDVDFSEAFERIIAGVASRKLRTPYERRVTAYHEAGHALVSEMLPEAKKTNKISLVPRGQALGYALFLPEEDRYIQSREEIMAEITVLLAGRCAEEEAIGRVHNGVADDIRRASALSRQMLDSWAMGSDLAADISEPGFLGAHRPFSEDFRRRRDGEQRAILNGAYQKAREIITQHRPVLDAIAETLLENEEIDRERINEILNAVMAKRDRSPDALPAPVHVT